MPYFCSNDYWEQELFDSDPGYPGVWSLDVAGNGGQVPDVVQCRQEAREGDYQWCWFFRHFLPCLVLLLRTSPNMNNKPTIHPQTPTHRPRPKLTQLCSSAAPIQWSL